MVAKFLASPPSQRGVIRDGVWIPVSRRARRAAWREFQGHATRNGALVGAETEIRSVRRQRAKELWRLANEGPD